MGSIRDFSMHLMAQSEAGLANGGIMIQTEFDVPWGRSESVLMKKSGDLWHIKVLIIFN